MTKPFLLIAGDNYYPSADTGDWKERFDSYEEAIDSIQEIPVYRKITTGKNKGEDEISYTLYKYKEGQYDWYCIVNLSATLIDQ